MLESGPGARAALSARVLGNSLGDYLLAAAVFLAVLWGFLLGRRVLLGRLRALARLTETDLDDLAVDLLELVKAPECYALAFFAATRSLALAAPFDRALRAAAAVLVAYRLATMLQAAAGYGIGRLFREGGEDPSRRATERSLSLAANAVVWAGAVLFTLGNLGFNVTSMLAGLGISGIAVALAAQAVLGDLFAAVAIHLDKPFVPGDAIKVGDAAGTVEHVGVKTTRVRSVSGETLVFPNSALTSSRIQNFRRMSERRAVVSFGLAYGTPEAVLADVPALSRRVVESDPLLRFERAHLAALGESSLAFELVYWVKDPDFNRHMDSQQAVLLGLLRELRARGAELAFPTRTVRLEGAPPSARA